MYADQVVISSFEKGSYCATALVSCPIILEITCPIHNSYFPTTSMVTMVTAL